MMKSVKFLAFLAAGIAAVGLVAGAFAQTTPPPPAASAEKIQLQYKMPAGQTLRYRGTGETREIRDQMGRTIEFVASATSTDAFLAKGGKDGHFLLGVTVEDRVASLSGDMGSYSTDFKPVLGKSFDMVLSPLGVEVDVTGAESLTFDQAGVKRDLAAGFRIFFPDLPDKPVGVGDTWPSSYTIETKEGPVASRMEMKIINSFDGFETVDGLECARITSTVSGVISGQGNQGGAELLFKGETKGTDVWHFAPKEGLYVGSTSELVSEITLTVSGAQSLAIPITQKRKGEVRLIGQGASGQGGGGSPLFLNERRAK